ncbi:hypothetical protein YQE_07879, partial [Dendroctonus ponderosae]
MEVETDHDRPPSPPIALQKADPCPQKPTKMELRRPANPDHAADQLLAIAQDPEAAQRVAQPATGPDLAALLLTADLDRGADPLAAESRNRAPVADRQTAQPASEAEGPRASPGPDRGRAADRPRVAQAIEAGSPDPEARVWPATVAGSRKAGLGRAAAQQRAQLVAGVGDQSPDHEAVQPEARRAENLDREAVRPGAGPGLDRDQADRGQDQGLDARDHDRDLAAQGAVDFALLM